MQVSDVNIAYKISMVNYFYDDNGLYFELLY